MKEKINIKITNAKQLINVLRDIKVRAAIQESYTNNYRGYESYVDSISTLIKVLEEAK